MQQDDLRLFIPGSVSPEARAIMAPLGQALAAMPKHEPPRTQAEFDADAQRAAAMGEALFAGALRGPTGAVVELMLGGAPVLQIDPAQPKPDVRPLVYLHGGGFVQGSARSRLETAALAAETSGRRVYSIDYTLAPRADWQAMQAEILSAWTEIADREPRPPGVLGDSAGGCLALALALRLRELGGTPPGALALLSPLTDLAGRGDTNVTLAASDFMGIEILETAARTYAPGADLANPLISPVHADFTPGFPPVLIQVGTREILLSDSVRLHRALRAAGQASRLEVYEGMPHVFQPLLSATPEGRQAWAELAVFFDETLEPA